VSVVTVVRLALSVDEVDFVGAADE